MTPARQGLELVFTGDGKGKTTAAIGLTVRAAGNKMRVFFLQFIKGQWKTGERDILRNLPGVDLEVTGRGFTIESLRNPNIPMEDHAAAAAHGWHVAQQIVHQGEYDLVVLEEVIGGVTARPVPLRRAGRAGAVQATDSAPGPHRPRCPARTRRSSRPGLRGSPDQTPLRSR